MNAGRELDAMIAEKVMGHGPHEMQYIGGRALRLPKYSADIAAAWQVAEHIVAMHLFPSLTYRGRGEWGCHIERLTSDDALADWHVRAIANTAPLAICLAALKALGVEVPA